MLCDRGLVVVDISDAAEADDRGGDRRARDSTSARPIAVQFRYAFVTDADGLKVVDVTVPETAAARAERDA